MLFSSPFPTLTLPSRESTLPRFLLDPSDSHRTAEPLLFPPPPSSPFHSNRPNATALSLDDVRRKAYQTAKSIIQGSMDGKSSAFERGDVVAIYSPNQHDYLAIIFGIHLVGGVAALCNPSYKTKELAHQLRMTRCRCVITSAAAGVTSGDSMLDKAREAIHLACNERDDDSGGAFDLLKQPPALFVFEEGHEASWSSISEQVQVTVEVKKEVDEKSLQVEGDDAAILCFSSGTSGFPKAVILTHSNLIANTIQASFLLHDRMNAPLIDGKEFSKDGKTGWYDGAQERGAGRHIAPVQQSSEDQDGEGLFGKKMGKEGKEALQKLKRLVPGTKNKGERRVENRPEGQSEFHIDVLPQFHCYGLLVNLVAVHTCTPRIILPRFHLETYLQCISDHGVTFSFVVPPILLALAKHPLVKSYDTSSLWRVASGAASLPDEIANAVGKRLGIRCTDGYGMTEMSPIISMQNVTDIEEAPGTVGALAPNTQALVLDSEGKELGPNESGELILRGPQMMKGYLGNEEANGKAFLLRHHEGEEGESKWLRTGDVAKVDNRGYITITDRLKDVIKAKGFQVSPAELEAVLFKDSRIADVAVAGIQDDKDGAERPWAFVVAHESVFANGEGEGKDKDGVAKSIMEKANGQMAGYKKIEGITWLDAMPKSDAGKVLKKNLAALR